ncbi:hypothetical protein C0992_012881, partial [Termitomyces sp. T32_za158]
KSKAFNPEKPDEELIAQREDQFDELSAAEDDNGPPELITQRDEIGLIHLIAAKERSSAKRKQLFLDLQRKVNQRPRQLLGDMPVRWSSTYVMLDRAETLKEAS